MTPDELLFLQIYRTHTKAVQRLVCRVVPRREDAEEVIQNVFLKVHRHLGDFRGQPSAMRPWILRIALNETRTYWRKSHIPLLPISDDETLSDDEPMPLEEQTELRMALLQQAVRLLDPADQTLLHLYYTDGLSLRQAGELLERTPAQLGKRLQTIRHKLYNLIKRMEENEKQ